MEERERGNNFYFNLLLTCWFINDINYCCHSFSFPVNLYNGTLLLLLLGLLSTDLF